MTESVPERSKLAGGKLFAIASQVQASGMSLNAAPAAPPT
jgi:hypothetical protein